MPCALEKNSNDGIKADKKYIGTDKRYSARIRFYRSLVYKKNFSSI